MDYFISVSFQIIASMVLTLRSTTVGTFSVFPPMLNALVADVSALIVKFGYGIDTVGVFGAVQAAAGEEAGQLGDGDAV